MTCTFRTRHHYVGESTLCILRNGFVSRKKNCVVGEMKPVKLVFTLPHLYCLSIFSLVEIISLAQKRSVLRAPYCHFGTTNWNL